MEVVPERLAELANTCLSASKALGAASTGALGGMTLPSLAAGNTAGGAALVSAHVATAEAATTAVGRLVAVLEADVDALYLCAFDFSTTDEDVAGSFESTYLDPDEPHPSPGPAPTPYPEAR